MVDSADADLAEFLSDTRCLLARLMDGLSEDDRRKTDKALAYSAISAPNITKFLKERKVLVSPMTVLRHRQHICPCYRNGE